MKLRIKGNSIRLRLSRSEVDAFQLYGSVADIIELPDHPLSYALEKADVDHLSVYRLGDSLRVAMPKTLAERWRQETEVGFSYQQPIGEKSISILVEKDFQCSTAEDCEPDADLYPNPKLG